MNDAKEMTIALAGNPNSGKTSIFNAITGAHQRVANFPGVTIEKREGRRKYSGYDIRIVDLPGSYSLAAYSPDEKVARDFIINENPDLIINVIDSGNLERSLYLTMQMIEMGVDVVIDLNMWDETQEAGVEINTERLSRLLGAPVVKTIGNRAQGIDALLDASISLKEDEDKTHRHPPISYGPRLDDIVTDLSRQVSCCGACQACKNPRWLAVKLLEGDSEIKQTYLEKEDSSLQLEQRLEEYVSHLKKTANQDPETAISEGRHGYIAGIVREVVKRPSTDRMKLSVQIDNILTHRFWGYPIFLLIIWLIFQATFKIGLYPMGWINAGVAFLQAGVVQALPPGFISDMIIDGVIGGLGAVIVFLPNIVILFLGVSILEDSGYMARAAFLMDRLMHFLGLHGKSFIPLLMGFGCNVPAIMATRTLESRKDRILTILLIPLMSCSARLPVYILLAGAFFPGHAPNVIFSVYLLGVAAAIGAARIFRKTLLRPDDAPFVMELPPYRWPTPLSILIHMWGRTKIYLRKMGGVILVASLVLWCLGYFPRKAEFTQNYDAQIRQLSAQNDEIAKSRISQLEEMKASEMLEYSFIGRLGEITRPVFAPLGFNWELGVSLLTGFVAKEVVVSTMGVLYHISEESETLQSMLTKPKNGLTPLAAYAFMAFVLLYTPCIPTIFAVKHEIGAKWMWFSVLFQAVLAWMTAFVIYQGGRLLGL